jgi:hypothetical protein
MSLGKRTPGDHSKIEISATITVTGNWPKFIRVFIDDDSLQ